VLRRRQRRGHNLLEAMLAAMLFATVVVGLLGLWEMQFQAMLKSKETAVASFVAEKIMEECVAAGFGKAKDLYSYKPSQVKVDSRTKSGTRTTVYRFEITVDSHPSSVDQELVTVKVYYNRDEGEVDDSNFDSRGKRTVEYHTYLNRNG